MNTRTDIWRKAAQPQFLIPAVLLAGVAYYFYRYATSPKLSVHVAKKLPVAKKLKTIADHEGNYDIDGVSFDSDGVIVSSDALTTGSTSVYN